MRRNTKDIDNCSFGLPFDRSLHLKWLPRADHQARSLRPWAAIKSLAIFVTIALRGNPIALLKLPYAHWMEFLLLIVVRSFARNSNLLSLHLVIRLIRATVPWFSEFFPSEAENCNFSILSTHQKFVSRANITFSSRGVTHFLISLESWVTSPMKENSLTITVRCEQTFPLWFEAVGNQSIICSSYRLFHNWNIKSPKS